MMASRGSESDPGDEARIFPFTSTLAEGLRGARSLVTLDTEPWCSSLSGVADEEDLAERRDRW